jgi:hypothetical protein
MSAPSPAPSPVTPNYDGWRADAMKILSNYKLTILSNCTLDTWVEPYSSDMVNFVMLKHIDKVKEAASFETCVKMVNDAMSAAMFCNFDLAYYIPDKQHQDTLYMLFSAWRAALLKQEDPNWQEEKKVGV